MSKFVLTASGGSSCVNLPLNLKNHQRLFLSARWPTACRPVTGSPPFHLQIHLAHKLGTYCTEQINETLKCRVCFVCNSNNKNIYIHVCACLWSPNEHTLEQCQKHLASTSKKYFLLRWQIQRWRLWPGRFHCGQANQHFVKSGRGLASVYPISACSVCSRYYGNHFVPIIPRWLDHSPVSTFTMSRQAAYLKLVHQEKRFENVLFWFAQFLWKHTGKLRQAKYFCFLRSCINGPKRCLCLC